MDVIITSASRDKSLKSEMGAFQKHVTYSGGFQFHLHEDRVPKMENSSIALMDWANKSGLFTTIYLDNPRVGRGFGLNQLKKHANSDYIFYMEEDFDFIKDVNLDELIKVMDKYTHINQICFNWRTADRFKKSVPKPGGPNGLDVFVYENRDFDGHIMNVTERWTWQPALWRRSWLMPQWAFSKQKSNKNFNRMLKNGIGYEEWNPKWHEKNIGSYYYGDVNDDEAYVEHTSWDVRHDREFL